MEEWGRHGGMNPTGSKVNGGSQQNGFSARGSLTGDLTREKAAHQSPVGPRDPHLNQLWPLGGARCRRALTCTGPLIAPPAVRALNCWRLRDVTSWSSAITKPHWEDGEVRRRPSVLSGWVFSPPPSPSCWLPTLQSLSLASSHSIAAPKKKHLHV